MLDLFHATRDDLIGMLLAERDARQAAEARLARQAEELAHLRQAIAMLSERIGELSARPDDDPRPGGGASAMPGHKPMQASASVPHPRKRRAHGAGRPRMRATAWVDHGLAACPACGAHLAGGTIKRTREVVDLPPPRIVVTEHRYWERRCPDCGKRCVPAPDLAEKVMGQGRFGHGLTSLLVILREEARLPVRTIQMVLATVTGLHVSAGAIVDASRRLADRASRVVTDLMATIRGGAVVHLDETGWREAGKNGYVWTASTSAARLFVHGTRQKAMVTKILGEQYPGVVVSDFFGAYTHDDMIHQYCWAHLLRDIADVTDQHPDDPVLAGWADQVATIFRRAQAGATGPPRSRWATRRQCQMEMKHLCQVWVETETPQRRLCGRMLTHLESLFTFVTDPAVPPTNNAAERSLRHLVVARKISGGTRSPRGTTTRMILASVFGTWRVQGVNPYDACRDLLASPQV